MFDSGSNLSLIEKKHLENFTNNDVKVFKFNKQIVDQIPSGIGKLFPNLKHAVFYANKLKKIRRSEMEELPNLIVLSFHSNFISYVAEDTFVDFKLLQSISISFNKLQNLPDRVFHNQPNLQRVYLNQNNLIMLKPELFEKNNRLEIVELQHNLLSIIAPFSESLPITNINLKFNFCIDVKISDQSEIKALNDNLMNRCTENHDDVGELVEKCAEELYYCKLDEIAAENQNKIFKNKKKRSLIL